LTEVTWAINKAVSDPIKIALNKVVFRHQIPENNKTILTKAERAAATIVDEQERVISVAEAFGDEEALDDDACITSQCEFSLSSLPVTKPILLVVFTNKFRVCRPFAYLV